MLLTLVLLLLELHSRHTSSQGLSETGRTGSKERRGEGGGGGGLRDQNHFVVVRRALHIALRGVGFGESRLLISSFRSGSFLGVAVEEDEDEAEAEGEGV